MSRATAAKIKSLPVLSRDGLTFEAWELQLKHSLYGLGCLPWYEASLDERNAPLYAMPEALELAEDHVQKVWAFIVASLDDKMVKKVDKVPLGAIGLLLVTIRRVFYDATPANMAMVRDQLAATELSGFEDVDVMIDALETLYKHLASMGEVVAEGAKIHKLLEALPESDYGQMKTAMKLPRLGLDPLSWDDHVAAIRNVAQNPNVAGTLSRSKKTHRQTVFSIADEEKQRHHVIRPVPVCRDHTAGRCTRHFCKFRHVQLPGGPPVPPVQPAQPARPRCAYCNKPGHSADTCFKKQREQANFVGVTHSP